MPEDSYLAFGPAAIGAKDRLMGGADAAAGGVDSNGVAWAGEHDSIRMMLPHGCVA